MFPFAFVRAIAAARRTLPGIKFELVPYGPKILLAGSYPLGRGVWIHHALHCASSDEVVENVGRVATSLRSRLGEVLGEC